MSTNPSPTIHQRALAVTTAWMKDHGVKTLRICVGLVYFWFGALKFAPDFSTEDSYLPGATIRVLSLGLLDNGQGIHVLAIWECFIGYCLVTAVLVRPALMLLLAHLTIMFIPAIAWPQQVWRVFPYGLTLKGQYIVKNLVFIASALMLVAKLERRPTPAPATPVGRLCRAFDDRLTAWVRRHGLLCVRIGMGVVYLWFGALKYFPGVSPAEQLAAKTVEQITLGLIPPSIGLPVLATWECFIGAGLLAGLFSRTILVLICAHLIGTFTPLFFFPEEIWTTFPFGLSLEGKYIVRNLVLYGAALMIGAELSSRRQGPAGRPAELRDALATRPPDTV
jgi:uncharacterized membrane protein YkgB